jgi:hypothetical protein
MSVLVHGCVILKVHRRNCPSRLQWSRVCCMWGAGKGGGVLGNSRGSINTRNHHHRQHVFSQHTLLCSCLHTRLLRPHYLMSPQVACPS